MKRIPTPAGVAPWKIDNACERYLARKADRSELWKRLYVQFYRIFDSKYYKGGLRLIDKHIELFVETELSKKDRKHLVTDMIYSLHRFGCMFDEYFTMGFPYLNAQGKDTFITDKNRWDYYGKLNTSAANQLFADKKKTYDKFKKYYRRELILIMDEKDKEAFRTFTLKNKEFIVKPYNSSGGRGVHKESVTDETWEDCFYKLAAEPGGVVCEELIIQSATMASFHPTSVNSMRMPAIRTKDGVKLLYPFIRTGSGGGVIDNALGGGLFALVDEASGIVYSVAMNESGKSCLKHPNTGVVYPGFQIPDWQQAVALVSELSTIIPENHYVGWDIAHTDDGWIMVEGNPGGQFVPQEIFMRTGIKSEMADLISRI